MLKANNGEDWLKPQFNNTELQTKLKTKARKALTPGELTPG